MQFCNSSDNNPEPGGPGTVYFDGYKSGSRHRVLSVDNQGRRPRVSFNSFYHKKPTETVLENNEKDPERKNKPNQANNGPIILYRLKGGGGGVGRDGGRGLEDLGCVTIKLTWINISIWATAHLPLH